MSAATEFRVESMLANMRDNNGAAPKGKNLEGNTVKLPARSPARPNKFSTSKKTTLDKDSQNLELREYQSQLQVV